MNKEDVSNLQSPFDAIKETDNEGREWWNSRKLARLLGYQKYWNFERLIDKVAPFLQKEKGLDLKEHIVPIDEMAQKRMAELFGVTIPDINYHLKLIDESGELQLSTAIRKIRIPSDNCGQRIICLIF
jgi:hypothetical protein